MKKHQNQSWMIVAIIAILTAGIFAGSYFSTGNALRDIQSKVSQPAKIIITSELTDEDYAFLKTAVPVGEVRTETYITNGVTVKLSSQDYQPQDEIKTEPSVPTETYSCVSDCDSPCYSEGCDFISGPGGKYCSGCHCNSMHPYAPCKDEDCTTCKMQKTSIPAPNIQNT